MAKRDQRATTLAHDSTQGTQAVLVPPAEPPASASTRSLIERLGDALAHEGIGYCQWKGSAKRQRWESGAGDIDLLVDRRAAARFMRILCELGFKRMLAPAVAQLPGIESYFGFDPAKAHLVHIHAHYRLIIGHYWTTTYHLPLEAAFLASAVPGPVFPKPAPECELVGLVLRMVQRSSLRDLLRRGAPRWLAAIEPELRALESAVSRDRLAKVLDEHLPVIDPGFFDACERSLHASFARWRRVWLRFGLRRRLAPYARKPPAGVTLARLLRWIVTLGGRLPWGSRPARKHAANGGRLIALDGGDGVGKSTCTLALDAWLSDTFEVTTAHFGRPPRSALTLAVGGVLKVSRVLRPAGRRRRNAAAACDATEKSFPGYLALLRDLCKARDRYRLYLKARQFATAGGVALCERYPTTQNRLLAGPNIGALLETVAHPYPRLGRLLARAEASYYRRILPPEVLIVLRLDPETAVRRKTTEPPHYVRSRNRIMWEIDWSATAAHVINADRPLGDVVADLKALVWAEL